MGDLPPRLCREPLKNIAIPGSHNSGSYFLDLSSGVAPGSPDTIRHLVSMFGSAAKNIIQNWSVCQTLCFRDQLEHGVRYFDMRISKQDGKPDIHLAHGLFAGRVIDAMNEINKWLDEHPKEVVLIDFNHVYQMDETHHLDLFDKFADIFSHKICPRMDCKDCTLEFLRENKWQVIIFYQDDFAEEYPTMWTSQAIYAPWPQTPEPAKMVNRLEAFHTRGRHLDKFHVTQGILTPTGTTVLGNLGSSLKDCLAASAIRNLQFFLKEKKIGEKGINIVLVDFVEMGDFIPTVLSLNSKE
uniref:PI-PLC X domain-containing protein 3-like n=1 Tax=Saccoglossus kowalevskii TaxID=10224 RepID=A0ABM0GVR4_SACKO|nr:PREDICTED: PI-PLC X domain-containing protein 3-like [Saccoglossus kowalevskii]